MSDNTKSDQLYILLIFPKKKLPHSKLAFICYEKKINDQKREDIFKKGLPRTNILNCDGWTPALPWKKSYKKDFCNLCGIAARSNIDEYPRRTHVILSSLRISFFLFYSDITRFMNKKIPFFKYFSKCKWTNSNWIFTFTFTFL